MGSGTGVYVGVWACEYVEVLASSPAGGSVFAGTAATCSVVAGRVSFALGMRGPCVSYDTACSSGLVASHAAMRALQYNECADALAAGVNMIFSAVASTGMGAAGMTCADAT
jgi:acyl transferase domain-containing protein